MKAVLPGSVVGVLGSGQLGRMFAIAARRMGYRVHTFSPLADTPDGPSLRQGIPPRLTKTSTRCASSRAASKS